MRSFESPADLHLVSFADHLVDRVLEIGRTGSQAREKLSHSGNAAQFGPVPRAKHGVSTADFFLCRQVALIQNVFEKAAGQGFVPLARRKLLENSVKIPGLRTPGMEGRAAL